MAARPTADRVKEALFSMLISRFDLSGAVVLDLFAGTGALGIEALSRGAGRAVFVEQDRATGDVLRRNIAACGFADRAEILSLPVRRALRELDRRAARFEGVFIDPPYGRGLLDATLGQLAATSVLRLRAWVVGERHIDDPLAHRYGSLQLTRTRRYGKTSLDLFCVAELTEHVAVS